MKYNWITAFSYFTDAMGCNLIFTRQKLRHMCTSSLSILFTVSHCSSTLPYPPPSRIFNLIENLRITQTVCMKHWSCTKFSNTMNIHILKLKLFKNIIPMHAYLQDLKVKSKFTSHWLFFYAIVVSYLLVTTKISPEISLILIDITLISLSSILSKNAWSLQLDIFLKPVGYLHMNQIFYIGSPIFLWMKKMNVPMQKKMIMT